MSEPWFWRDNSITAQIIRTALSPASQLYTLGQSLRWRMTKPCRAEMPVICLGNATMGGVGKTPFAIMLGEILIKEGFNVAFLTRGYRGQLSGPLLVNPNQHDARDVGDEALLLAAVAPTIKSHDKTAGIRFAKDQKVDLLIMDDGFQNPTVAKDVNILLVDAVDYHLPNKVFPAGSLRENYDSAFTRADIVVSIGTSEPPEWAGFSAWLEPTAAPAPQRVVATTGIGNPARFFSALERAGFILTDSIDFPDHHQFTAQDLAQLKVISANNDAKIIMTEKDAIRLNDEQRIGILVFPVKMHCNDAGSLLNHLKIVLSEAKSSS